MRSRPQFRKKLVVLENVHGNKISLVWLTGGWVDADIGGADEGRSLQGAVVLSCVGLQLISLGVEGAQEAGESRSLCYGQQWREVKLC